MQTLHLVWIWVIPLGHIKLKVTFGTAPCTASIDVNFIVADSPSVYNTIIGRATLHAIRAIASAYHMLLIHYNQENQSSRWSSNSQQRNLFGGHFDSIMLVRLG